MRTTKPVIYFVFCRNAGETSTRFGGFARRLRRLGDMPNADYKTVALEDLVFILSLDGSAKIVTHTGEQIFADASFVYFKSWESMSEQASMVVSYLQAKGIPFEDAAVRHAGTYKASQSWKLWSKSVSVLPTIIASKLPDKALVSTCIGEGPYILKPIHGEKGRGIRKVVSYNELALDMNGLMLQPYIENDGDYRVLTYGYEVRGALHRRGADGSIVNNTSQGGTSEFIAPDNVDELVKKIAVRAARATEHAVAGVDIIVGRDGVSCVLEVNQGSQIVTGHFVDKKAALFADFLREQVDARYPRQKQNDRLAVIGRYVSVNLPEFKIKGVFAKVDTGAYQSAAHATDIREVQKDGKTVLEFSLFDGHGKTADHKTPHCQVEEYEKTTIKNSFGLQQTRYVIKTQISINGRMMKTGITLTDRKDMVAPLLLGRRFLRGRYIVNVELGRIGWEKQL